MSDSIPDGWTRVEFDSFTTLQRGRDLTKTQFRAGTVPVAGSNGVIGYHDTAIAKAPGVWDYVIVHELLHFFVPNHGKLWKSLMRAHLGEYEAREGGLKRIAHCT